MRSGGGTVIGIEEALGAEREESCMSQKGGLVRAGEVEQRQSGTKGPIPISIQPFIVVLAILYMHTSCWLVDGDVPFFC